MNYDSTLFEFLAKLTVLSLALHVVLMAMKGRSASARHSVIRFGLAALLLLPIMKIGLPTWNVPGWIRQAEAGIQPSHAAPADLTAVLIGAWAVGCLFSLARTLVGLIALSRKNRGIDAKIDPTFEARIASVVGGRRVKVRIDEGSSHPMTWGHLHPTIILPANANAWNDRRLRAILEHEIAHVERADWLSEVLASLVSAIYWFHPLVWMARKRLAVESERAADDRALSIGCAPIDYAFHLLETAKAYRTPDSALGVTMAKSSHLKRRLTGILAKQCPRSPLSRPSAVSLALGFTILAAIVATATSSKLETPTAVATRKSSLRIPMRVTTNKHLVKPPKPALSLAVATRPHTARPQSALPDRERTWVAVRLNPVHHAPRVKTKVVKADREDVNAVPGVDLAMIDREVAQSLDSANRTISYAMAEAYDGKAKPAATLAQKAAEAKSVLQTRAVMRSQIKELQDSLQTMAGKMVVIKGLRNGACTTDSRTIRIEVPEVNLNVKIQVPTPHLNILRTTVTVFGKSSRAPSRSPSCKGAPGPTVVSDSSSDE